MVKKISIAIVMILAFIALLQGNVFAAEKFPEAVDGVIKLTEDVTLAEPAIINSAVTLDLNGHKINHTVAFWDFGGNEENDAVIVVQAGGDLTIKGEGTLTALKDDCYGISVRNGGKLKIYGGTYIGNVSAVYVRKGSAEIYGGTFDLDQLYNGYIYELNCKDEAYKDGSASIITYGGTYKNFSPDNAAEPSAPQSYVPVGYESVKDGENYKVVIDDDYELQNLIKTNEKVTLNRDYVIDKLLLINKSVTINLNGHNISRRTEVDNAAVFYVDDPNAVLTVEGSGNVTSYGPAVWSHQGNIVLKGGNYESYLSDTIYAQYTGKIEILGGSYNGGTSGKTPFMINLFDSDRATASIIIKGGTYNGFDPANNAAEGPGTNFVAEGYKSVNNAEKYEVVCAHKTCTKEPERPATYVEEGNESYYVCNICSKWFKTWSEGKEATDEITDKSSIVIPKLIEVNDKKDEVVVKNEAVDNAVADATANNTDVVIPLGNIGTTVSSVELPVEKLEVVAGTDKALVVETTEAVVTIDNKTLEEVVKQAGAEPTITLEVKKIEEKVLSEKQQNVIENKEVAFVFKAEIFANGKEISNFGGGKVKVAIPFTPAENTNASDYKVFYIADDGSISEVLTQYVDGKIVVELEHFSEYALINVNKVANQGGTGSAAPAPATKDNTPKTGAMSFVVVLMVIASVGYVVTKKEIR